MARPESSRLKFWLVAVVFFGPLLLAVWMYNSRILRPADTTNHGALLDPIVNLADGLPDDELLSSLHGHWVMVYVDTGPCGETCRDTLYRLRQTRLMLGSNMDRMLRLFLHGDVPPDTVFLDNEHPGLISASDDGLAQSIQKRRPAGLAAGGIFLVDPLANLVMYFPPDLAPHELVDDVKHLLELSRIG